MSQTSEHDTDLDDLDRALLNALQWDFPVDPQPYATLADRLDTTEDDVCARVARIKDVGVLRQLSAIFDTRALGYGSSLVAAKVDPDHIDAVPPGASLDEHLDVLHRDSGSLVTRKLPTLQLYKIGVKLDMTGSTAADARSEVLEHERPERRPDMVAPVLSAEEIATIRVVQEDLPLSHRPFADQAGLVGVTEDELLAILASFKERKLMRRFAAVMNHRSAGFKANAMGVWAVPEDELDDIGPRMAGFSLVSHCYKRPTYEDWPYSVFTMVHGKNARECEQTIAAIQDETGVEEFALLWSVKEYKKTRVKYFTPDWDEWALAHGLGGTAPLAPVTAAAGSSGD